MALFVRPGLGAGVWSEVLFVVIRRTVSIPSVSNEGSRSLMLALAFSVLLFCIQNCPLQGRNTAQALDGESRTKKGSVVPEVSRGINFHLILL